MTWCAASFSEVRLVKIFNTLPICIYQSVIFHSWVLCVSVVKAEFKCTHKSKKPFVSVNRPFCVLNMCIQFADISVRTYCVCLHLFPSRSQGCCWKRCISFSSADQRAAHPPRQSHKQHLHSSGAKL